MYLNAVKRVQKYIVNRAHKFYVLGVRNTNSLRS